jgi:hypothetical protein
MERIDLCTLMLEWGSSIHSRNARGRTPYQYALTSSPDMVRTLLTKDRVNSVDDNGSSALHIAIQERVPLSTISIILELGAGLASVDMEGRNPVRLAVDMDLWEIAKLLADSGADIFTVAQDGKTTAEVSLSKGETAVRAVFSGNAININDPWGNTILHFAARHGDANIITLLLSLGAFKEARNIAAESPADIAARWNHSEAVALLQ